MTILYFTATGNSLFVAKQFGGNLVSIPRAIKDGKYEFSDDVIGVICPIYGNLPPKIVLSFLSKSSLEASYKFMILTYGHMNINAPGFAAEALSRLNFDYISDILMVDNYLPLFDVEKECKTDKKTNKKLSEILKNIAERKKYIPKITKHTREKSETLQKIFSENPQINNGSQIAITDKCVGCGICVKVCPVGNFYLENGVAKRKRETCEFCLACANLCTNQAIVCKLSDKNPHARYRNPNIALCEIIKSNEQVDFENPSQKGEE